MLNRSLVSLNQQNILRGKCISCFSSLSSPSRGFTFNEYRERTSRTQFRMLEENVDVLLITTKAEFEYYTGWVSQFWESPTRPWFLAIPAHGKPIAIVPSIGVRGFESTWIERVRTWESPSPLDEGLTLVGDTLLEIIASTMHDTNSRIGFQMGHESTIRMPQGDFISLTQRLADKCTSVDFVDVHPIIREVRSIKSPAEISKTRFMCQVASECFERLPEKMHLGLTERECTKLLQEDLLRSGADSIPYMIAQSGYESYNNIIMGPTDRIIGNGDVLVIDTGSTYDGYFCDFDRNFAFGKACDSTKYAFDVVYEATEAGISAAIPGNRACDIFFAMNDVIKKHGYGTSEVGRMGHGLGTQLTEWPSIMPTDETVIKSGMILSIEPSVGFGTHFEMAHEENVLVTEEGKKPELLSKRAPSSMPVILK